MSPATTKIIVIAIVLFVAAAAVFVLMGVETKQEGEKLTAQLDTINQQRAREESFYRLKREAQESALEREQLSDYFFANESESIDFLNLVENLAPEVGVTLKTNSLNVVEDKDTGKQWVEFNYSFTGSRNRVHDFIALLEGVPFVAKITTVVLSTSDKTTWRANLTIRVRILTYDT